MYVKVASLKGLPQMYFITGSRKLTTGGGEVCSFWNRNHEGSDLGLDLKLGHDGGRVGERSGGWGAPAIHVEGNDNIVFTPDGGGDEQHTQHQVLEDHFVVAAKAVDVHVMRR